jgi:hypothetical protein
MTQIKWIACMRKCHLNKLNIMKEFDDMGDINDMVEIWQYGWNQQHK